MAISKSELRKELIARRKALLPQQAEKAAHDMTAHLAQWLAAKPSARLAGYVPMHGEINIIPLMEQMAAAGHETSLPVVEGLQRELVFRRWQPGEALEAGAFNTRIPPAEAAACVPDVLLVPLVGIDPAGVRLGYGGGYYDATLAVLRKAAPVVAVGVAYDCQRVAALPRDPHDALLDGVVSESGLEFFNLKSQKKA